MTVIFSEHSEAPNRLALLLRTRPELILAPLSLVVLLLAWEYGVVLLDVPKYILPPPSAIAVALWRGLDAGIFDRGGYWLHAGVTVSEVLLGFVIGSSVGLILGTIISQFRILDATLRVYLVAIQSLPKIALAPIIVLWFGFGLTSKVVIICLLTFFPAARHQHGGLQGGRSGAAGADARARRAAVADFLEGALSERAALHLRRPRHGGGILGSGRGGRRVRGRAARARHPDPRHERADGYRRHVLGLRRPRASSG